MDVHKPTRDRVFSILNDNNCPSFVIRQRPSSPTPVSPTTKSFAPTASPVLERPNLFRQSQYQRNHSVSSSTDSPPLLRYDSSSSSKSNRSMDSTPSPITPAYHYNDNSLVPYDSILRQDLGSSYLPSPSTITPFLEQQLMIAPLAESYQSKSIPPLIPSAYPIIPIPTIEPQMPTPTTSGDTSISSTTMSNPQQKTSPSTSNSTVNGKKNKYPCPYASSHNCMATFTTSGHAARHGKKHTGEKGVHCPICDKAFTRKDNMKQHERTHKNHTGAMDETSKRSKAAITKDAQKSKVHANEADQSFQVNRSSMIQSPVSEVASLTANTVDTPANVEEVNFYPESSSLMMMVPEAPVPADTNSTSLYPPLGDDNMLSNPSVISHSMKLDIPQPPALLRGFSDLDTLAQAAESFDPYYQNTF